ncbi:type I polyketide synthase [Amycolatopsis orientalis]|uniref:type I polyketide synthase n=1 Tax=Amycolatopsis orientalis TaxID=31958 RepID=UPI0004230CA0|nr:type I polyketide synthase [Amycolatopsis orientalis]
MAEDSKVLDTLNRLTTALRDTRERLRSAEAAAREPIAIVGLGCRLPGGATDPDALWRLLDEGRDAITSLPADRGWPRGRTGAGGFLADAAWFDAGFFGIGPNEAQSMDPQQRLMLEISWESLERAGIDPATLRGSRTGVFTGTSDQDYRGLVSANLDEYADHLATATAASVLSGRVSYLLGLEGPSVTIDTACSSSLVALHLAVRSLRAGECDLALAGGAVVMSKPGVFTAFRHQGALAADGRCKAFAEAADGVGWGEGAGVVVVERLTDALASGHPVLAVVRGSAVNSDGASNGLTAPNGLAQQRVIRDALADAGLRAEDVDAVEAHGTGTRLGDPIEAAALQAAYGHDRDTPLALGSIKANIGHTQAAAGIAGVLKIVLALRHRTLPKTLHVDRATSQVDWHGGGVELLTESRPWQAADGRPRRAAVSSFGISGTNAHVILEEAPAPEPAGTPAAEQLPWVLSARTESALRARAGQLLSSVDGRDPVAVAHALITSRSTFDRRAVVLDADPRTALTALNRGTAVPGLVTGTAELTGKVVFVFPGQGGQWAGMAGDLLETSPVFKEHLERCARALAPHLDWDLLAVLRQEPDAPSLDRVDVVQPALFAVMVSLAALWRASGIEPDAVVGHSQGEIAAAHVAGALSLEDAALVVARRAKALTTLSGRGGMASVELPAERLRPRLDERLAIATVNGPESSVVAGDIEALDRLLTELAGSGVQVRRLAVDYASHSPQVESVRDRVLAELAPISPRPTDIPFHSAVTATVLAGPELDAGYWYRNLRMPVRFDAAVAGLPVPEHTFFVEVSPHPVLVHSVLAAVGDRAVVTGTLRRAENGRDTFLAALAELYVRGLCPKWTAWAGQEAPGFTELPTYPFERKRFWVTPGETREGGHPVLDAPVELADTGELVLTGRLSVSSSPWLADHRVLDEVILPGTAWLDFALRAGTAARCPTVEELTLERPLVVPDDAAVTVQLRVGAPDGTGRRGLRLHAKVDGGNWVHHGGGTLSPERIEPAEIGQWPPAGAEPVAHQGLYPALVERGLRYGPTFQGLRAVWRRDKEVFAEVDCPVDGRGFVIHPALLDSALHALGFGGPAPAPATDGPVLPFVWAGVGAHATEPATLRVRLQGLTDDSVRLGVTDEAGVPVLSVDSLVLRPAVAHREAPRDALFRSRWAEVRTAVSTGSELVVTVGIETGRFPAFPDLDALENAVSGGLPMPDAVLLAVSGGAPRESAHHALASAQWWTTRPEFAASRLVFLTSGAVATRTGDDVGDLGGAAVTGLVRSAQAEEPGRFVLLDADEITPLTVAAALATDEPELALRGGRVLARRLVRVVPPAPVPFAGADDVVLITGGTGTLGGLLARHLVTAHGVRRLVLLSRGGHAPDLVAALAELGAVATTVACDVTDRTRLARVLADHRPTIVVHAAGALDDGVMLTMTADRLDTVMRPKADAAIALHELTKELPLKAFVLFSSAAATAGTAGQSNYAAANAVLDGLAHHRRGRGLPAISLAWGLWAERSDLTGHLRTSADMLSTKEALALFDAAVSLADPVLVPARLTLDDAEDRPLLRELKDRPGTPDRPRPPLDPLGGPDRERALVDLVLDKVALTLGHADTAELNQHAGFLEMGVDSLAAVRIRNHLAEALGRRLRATVTFDHPTPAMLARYLAELVSRREDDVVQDEDREDFRQRLQRIRVSGWERNRAFFGSLEQLPSPPRPVRLASGSGHPALVCVPSITGQAEPVQYARLARAFQDEREVLALRHPGYRGDGALPKTRDLLLAAHAASLRAELGDRPFVLTGLSSGGLVAHLLAEHLHGQGTPPAGVVVLDSYLPSEYERLVRLLPGLGDEMQLRMADPNYPVPADDSWITAMLHYGTFDWTPAYLPIPVLFVRAGDPVQDWPPDWEPVWPFEHTAVSTRGNHFTMMEEHAPHTAALMNDWMRGTFG